MEGNATDSSLKQESTMENQCVEVELNNARQDTIPDSESVNSEESGMFGSDFIRLDENDELYLRIKERILLDLDGLDLQTEVVSIYKNSWSSSYWPEKLKAFQSYVMTHEEMGNANVRHAWFTASKPQMVSFLSRGYFPEPTHNGIYGRGVYVYLSPHHLAIDCLQSSLPDEDGMKYMALCSVVMGRMELIHPISKQSCSSSQDYPSGVNDLVYPTKYIICNGHMNSHIIPTIVIGFKSSKTNLSNIVVSSPTKKPRSPRIPISTLIDDLSSVLP